MAALRYGGMRIFTVALVAVVMGSLLAASSAASCGSPGTVAENATRAEAVIYGVVTQSERGAVTVRIDHTLKGQVAGTLLVFVGPGRAPAGDTGVATSVDYPNMSGPPAVGSAHVLYLIRGSGKLETNACIGSHPGGPSAEELAYFGVGITPTGTPTAPDPFMPPVNAGPNPTSPLLWLLMILAVAAGVVALVRRHRLAPHRF